MCGSVAHDFKKGVDLDEDRSLSQWHDTEWWLVYAAYNTVKHSGKFSIQEF